VLTSTSKRKSSGKLTTTSTVTTMRLKVMELGGSPRAQLPPVASEESGVHRHSGAPVALFVASSHRSPDTKASQVPSSGKNTAKNSVSTNTASMTFTLNKIHLA